jgi:hypothetical protein
MTSRPAPTSIAENTAKEWSGITANTGEPEKSKARSYRVEILK